MGIVSVADFPLWSCLGPVMIVAPWIISFGVFGLVVSLFRW